MKDTRVYRQIGKDPLYKTWHAGTRPLFLYVHSDGGSIVTKDRSYPLRKNVLALILPGTYHYTMPDDPDCYDRSKLLLSPAGYAGIGELLRPYPEFQSLLGRSVVYAQIPPEDRGAVDRIFAEAEARATGGSALLLLSDVLRLLFFLQKHAAAHTADAGGFMSKALRYIHGNISAELTIDGICGAINVSKYHFCRQFKRQLGMTVMQYILHTRIVLAGEALEKSSLPVAQISEKYGFSSSSYFCRVFREATGFTPLQYRRRPGTGTE